MRPAYPARLCGLVLSIWGVGEVGVPAPVVVGEGVVEDSGAYLEEQVRPAGAPPHLLFFDHAFFPNCEMIFIPDAGWEATAELWADEGTGVAACGLVR
jgi:hypothetical protein